MNYILHYNRLINRARNRTLETYTESHHIIPKCMNGNDEKENLVNLTAREHFIAHILLVKIYPKEHGLIKAVQMMCIVGQEKRKVNNRMYGWLKEKFSKEQSRNQRGEGNSQFGLMWIYNLELRISIKIKKDELTRYLDLGWSKGRKINFDYIKRNAKKKSKYKNFLVKRGKIIKRRIKLECSRLNKIELEKQKKLIITEERELYKNLFEIYLEGEYTSIRDFVNNKNMYNKSHVTLTKKFKKYIKNYNKIVKPCTGKTKKEKSMKHAKIIDA